MIATRDLPTGIETAGLYILPIVNALSAMALYLVIRSGHCPHYTHSRMNSDLSEEGREKIKGIAEPEMLGHVPR